MGWFTGNGQDGLGDDGPETPAHAFVAKAFKTALFGTPAPPREDENEEEDYALKLVQGKAGQSPAKGILLTPGTVGTKRKTVSFGGAEEPKAINTKSLSAGEEKNEEPRSISVPVNSTSTASHQVRRSLFNKPQPFQARPYTRNQRPEPVVSGPKASEPPKVPEKSQQDPSADVTVDLEQPRSVSGRHWMKEYQRDHAMSKVEMKKLIRYSQTSKLHAAKRDREAARLREKLERSESRVKELEREVVSLKGNARSDLEIPQMVGSKSAAGDDDSSTKGPERELSKLRKVANEASTKASRLERENESFRKTILRVKDEMAKYESRHKKWVEQRQRKDEKHAAQRKSLKEKVISYRSQLQEQFDAFQEKAESDKAALMREIDFLRNEISSSSPSKAELLGSGEPLRQLLARIHERPRHGEKSANDEPTRKSDALSQEKNHSRTPLQRIRDEWQDVEESSSPTILEGHIRRASKKSSDDYSPIASRTSLARPAREKLAPSPRPSIIPYSPASRKENDENKFPAVTKRREGGAPLVSKAARGVRVKSRHGMTGRPAVSSTRSGLTPEREAAARLRIAQRSAEKQKNTKFLFEDEGWSKENRNVLGEKSVNRV